jgi:hypothetical protein
MFSLLFALMGSARAADGVVSAPELTERGPRPRWIDQEPDPRAQTDFTAYTLEPGEVRLGLRSAGFGILPGIQLTTQPVVDALGMPNVCLKVDPLQIGPSKDGVLAFDLGGNASLGHIRDEPLFRAVYVTAGGNASLIVSKAWSLHLGAQWMYFAAVGNPDIEELGANITALDGLNPAALQMLEKRLAYEVRIETVFLSAATDIRLNRRDSIVLQGRTALWSWTELPDLVGAYGTEDKGFLPIGEAWSASIAWQLHFRNVDLRIGVGASSVPGAWALETFDLAWRFGGRGRSDIRQRTRGWRLAPTLDDGRA